MTEPPIERLRVLARAIVDPRTPAARLGPVIRALASLLRELATIRIESEQVSAEGETYTAAGRALSPTMAGRCADDTARTAVFVRGVHQAVSAAARRRTRRRAVSILYAGCGPYALLALPTMAILGPSSVEVTLLDIHKTSSESAQTVVEALGLGACVAAVETTDATEYRIAPSRRPDLLLSETMNACLAKEPQVTIAWNLHRQAPGAALVPETIRVVGCLLDPSKEFSFAEAESGMAPAPACRDRVSLGTVFELSARTIASWTNLDAGWIPGGSIAIPNPLDPRYVPMLLTEVLVHGEHLLRDYDSGLTLPKHIPLAAQPRGGETLAFRYRLGRHPGLECEVL